MSRLVLLLAAAVALLWLFRRWQRWRRRRVYGFDLADAFAARSHLMSRAELRLYHRLVEALPRHRIFANVRLSDLLDIREQHAGFERRRRFHKIAAYHVDFVVTTPDSAIVAAIELDDASHLRPERHYADQLKDDVFAAIGTPLLRYTVRDMPDSAQLRADVLRHGLPVR